MKIYVFPNRIVMAGKAWEIRNKLREYSKAYKTVAEWMEAASASK
ncbi:Z-ring formation inhibitor MciZ [Ectobacillus ponti]|uniref:Z-ring formation inhibitor MciZ n=1 Tax=Ectobacillus ponti TaxID=2961894 RepID=A0AA41X0Z9_9BACI|nr:Z-ring formation inhibitor MciZ [Ectobacillus ponti]MCP8966966.1 Z-ring formation inhibitor MciZ [Ectobacillus ponti]